MQRVVGRRAYATFVPHSSTRSVFPLPPKPSPSSPSFYAGNYNFHDRIIALEKARTLSERALRQSHVLPLPKAVRDSLPSANRPVWKKIEGLQELVGSESKLKTSQYRKVTKLLGELHDMRVLAQMSANHEVQEHLNKFLQPFEREDVNGKIVEATGFAVDEGVPTRKNPTDQYGRTYALGRRKESSARVWIIPTKTTSKEATSSTEANSTDIVQSDAQATSIPPVSTILINNLPLATFFPHITDRERIVRPFKLTGTLGAFNVFAISRGGGTSGQAGAVAHGISKALAAHLPDVKKILSKAQLLTRDPRMVERKKTGMPKARKRYTWVKR